MQGQLVVEGKDDKHVVWALCKKHNLSRTFEVEDTGGIEKLFAGVPRRLKSGNLAALGIVLDADTDLAAQWQRTKAVFEKPEFGYSLPARPEVNGTIISHPDEHTIFPLRIGVWLMPNNQLEGILEDFMQELVIENDPLFSMATETVKNVATTIASPLRFADKDRSKALIHTYLAWQEDPGTPMGQAITKKYFDSNAAVAKRFVDWLNRLFNPET